MSVKFAKTVVPSYATPDNIIRRPTKPRKAAASRTSRGASGASDSGELLDGGVFSPDDKASSRARKRVKSPEEQLLDGAIDTSARFLVTHNGRLLATFVSEDDALLFEGELADIDVARGTDSALCEVRDRRGRLLGGYVITAGRLCAFVRDEHFNQRFGGAVRKTA